MSEYYSSVWGNRLYLNLGLINGKNVTVIYNHLSAYRSHVGAARHPRPGRRAGRHDRLVHRLPHPLHRHGQRHGREPDPLVRLTAEVGPVRSPGGRRSADVASSPVDRSWDNGRMPKEQGRKMIAQNRKARHDYHVEDTWEAGLVLMGTEVKSLRQGRATLVDGFAEVDGHEVWLHGVHIPEYTQGTWTNHAARRRRKLLLNRVRDRQDRAQGRRQGLHAGAALALLQGRPRQGRDRAGQGQEVLRQAPRPRRAPGRPREAAGDRAPRSRACPTDGLLGRARRDHGSIRRRNSGCRGCSTSTRTFCRRG